MTVLTNQQRKKYIKELIKHDKQLWPMMSEKQFEAYTGNLLEMFLFGLSDAEIAREYQDVILAKED